MTFDAVVIGSGFGGAVSACRLAQAGFSVCILERGKRYAAGDFPRAYDKPVGHGWFWQGEQGIFDAKPVSAEMFAVQAAGWGGGSLLYSNVIMRPPADLFEKGWPEGYSLESLTPYYELVEWMLGAHALSESQPLGLPPRTHQMRDAAAQLGRQDQWFLPRLAVDFGTPGEAHPNRFGVTQRGCTHCGECNVGCNEHAKNTLDLNYLALAEQHGATARTRCEVQRIEPDAEGGYRVIFNDLGNDPGNDSGAGGAEQTLTARQVFLCCGAINSTELLLRCRDVFHTLPALSPRLGDGYSGNGDFLAFGFGLKEACFPSRGPVITSALLYDRVEADGHRWFLLEDSGVPLPIARYLQVIDPRKALFAGTSHMLWEDLQKEIRRVASQYVNDPNNPTHSNVSDPAEPAQHTQLFLVMGRDRGDGKMYLHLVTKRLAIRWELQGNLPLYASETRLSTDIVNALGGQAGFNPAWTQLHQPIATHNLGGCRMAATPDQGVTDPFGEVHGYPGLFVLDGAVIPGATGANPANTIAAVAERNIEAFIRRARKDASWRAPERLQVTPQVEPLSQVKIPQGGSVLPHTPGIGFAFTETMRGFGVLGYSPPDDFAGAETAGKAAGTHWEFTLDIATPDLDGFLDDPDYTANAQGRLRIDGLTPAGGAPVTAGVFNMFEPTDSVFSRRMLYALPFYGADGRAYLLDGYKDVRDHGGFDVWGATSTLYTVIREGHSRGGRILGSGIIHVQKMDFIHQLTTMRVTGTEDKLVKLRGYERFGKAFAGTLWDVFVRPKFE